MRLASLALMLMAGCDAPQTAAAEGPRLLQPTDPAGSVADFGSLQGRWRVVGVALVPGPVQAYVRDDPAWMGRELRVSGKTLAWLSADGAAPSPDRCAGAATRRITGSAAERTAAPLRPALAELGVANPDPHEIACLDGGQWHGEGGGALLFPVDARTLVMSWYDNLLLKLRWQGA